MFRRTVLIGANNPLSSDSDRALYPYPEGATGWRLWRIFNDAYGTPRSQWLQIFDRRNVMGGKTWNMDRARITGRTLRNELVQASAVVFGHDARVALRLPERPWLVPTVEDDGLVWRFAPHPSRRNMYYNDPVARQNVALMLWELADWACLGMESGPPSRVIKRR